MADSASKKVDQDERFEKHLITGGDLLRKGEVEDAVAEFTAALEIHPDDERGLGLLGLSLFRLANFPAARDVYEKLVGINANDASYRLNLGLVFLKMGEPLHAIAELRQSRDLDPSQMRTVSYLGLAYARNGDYAEAYEAFLRADQSALAAEMEQYLSEEERGTIRARIGESQSGGAPVDVSEGDLVEEEEDVVEEDDVQAADAEAPDDAGEEAAAAGDAARPHSDAGAAPAEAALPEGMITQAVEAAGPNQAAAAAATRTAFGHEPPRALGEFATASLIRPDDGDHAMEIGAGDVLIVRVSGRVLSRTDHVIISSGELGFEAAMRRVRGTQTDEAFEDADGTSKMFVVSGVGYLVASPNGAHFSAVRLDDDILYLRENLVYAFEEVLHWESGRVPGSRSAIRVVQFRGTGCVAMRTSDHLQAIKLTSERVMYVEADVLAGWIGRVVPRLVEPAAGGRISAPFVECSGEGIVLLEHRDGR